MNCEKLKQVMTDCYGHQLRSVHNWHNQTPSNFGGNGLLQLVLAQHWTNFKLWHVEDKARRKDVDDKIIADCKRDIDGFNQQRNDQIEQIDAWIVRAIGDFKNSPTHDLPFNSETVGSIVDRLSIMALKIYHMAEQTRREDVDKNHILACQKKVDILLAQRHDLFTSLLNLIDDYGQNLKQPKVYFQFKMYNDPSLNPEIYGAKKD